MRGVKGGEGGLTMRIYKIVQVIYLFFEMISENKLLAQRRDSDSDDDNEERREKHASEKVRCLPCLCVSSRRGVPLRCVSFDNACTTQHLYCTL